MGQLIEEVQIDIIANAEPIKKQLKDVNSELKNVKDNAKDVKNSVTIMGKPWGQVQSAVNGINNSIKDTRSITEANARSMSKMSTIATPSVDMSKTNIGSEISNASGSVTSMSTSLKSVVNELDLAYASATQFDAVLQNASNTELRDVTKQLKLGIAETEQNIKEMQLELLSLDQIKVNMSDIKRISQDIQVANADLSIMKSRLSMLGKSAPTQLMGAFFNGISARASALSNKISILGSRIRTAFMFAAFGTFRKGFQDAIALSDTASTKFGALGSIIAGSLIPIIDALASAVRNAFVWIAGLVKFVTGFNMLAAGIDATNKKIAKTNSGLKKTGTTAKKTISKMLAGFDEINNIKQEDSGNSGSSGGASAGGSADLGNLKELKSMLDDMNKMDFSWAQPLKDVFNFIKDNWGIIVVALVAITAGLKVFALVSALTNVALLPLAIAIAGIVAIVIGLAMIVFGIIELFKEGGDQTKAWTYILGGLALVLGVIVFVFNLIPLSIAAIIAIVVIAVLFIIKNWETVKEWFGIFLKWLGDFFGAVFDGIVAIVQGAIDLVIAIFKFLWEVIVFVINGIWEVIKLVFMLIVDVIVDAINFIIGLFKSIINIICGVFTTIWNFIANLFGGIGKWFGDRIGEIVKFFSELPNKVIRFVQDLWNGIVKIFGKIGTFISDSISGAIKAAINAVVKTGVNIINGFISAINIAIDVINLIPMVNISKLQPMNVPSFDVGTPNVPYDMLANIHKGEAIIPAKFNDKKFFGGNGDVDLTETNNLLQMLIEVMIGKNFTIDGDKVGEVAVRYINKQNRLRGESVI